MNWVMPFLLLIFVFLLNPNLPKEDPIKWLIAVSMIFLIYAVDEVKSEIKKGRK